jgi:hypothetical protein
MMDDLGHRIQAFLQRKGVGVVLRPDVICCFLRSLEIWRALQSNGEAMELRHPGRGPFALRLSRESTLSHGRD